jgi:predicted transcriptional regulator
MTMSDDTFIQLTADIVSAHLSNNSVALEDIAGLIESVFAALSNASNPVAPAAANQEPAVSVRASVKPDYIVCLEDGMKLKTLKRHLRTSHDMTPADYRAKWNLPSDYPLVASSYSEKRREVSFATGLGRTKAPETIAEALPELKLVPAIKRSKSKKASAEPAQATTPEAARKSAPKPRAKKSPRVSSE